MIVTAFFSVYEMAIDTIFLCFRKYLRVEFKLGQGRMQSSYVEGNIYVKLAFVLN